MPIPMPKAADVDLVTSFVDLVVSVKDLVKPSTVIVPIQVEPASTGVPQQIASDLKQVEETASAAGTASGSKFSAGLKNAFSLSNIAGGAVDAFKQLYSIGEVFDSVTDTIRVGTGAQGESLDSLVASVKAVGTQVPADFSAIGPVVGELNTHLGLTGSTLETVASQYLQAGKMLGSEVDISSTTAAFSAFNVQGDAVAGSMDQLFRISQVTGIGINDLAASVQTMSPTLKELGFSFADSASLAASFSKAGMDSESAIASMSSGMKTLAKEGEAPAATFKRVTGEVESLVAQGNTAAAIDLASGIFGTEGASQFVGAVESGSIALDDLAAAAGSTGDTILGVAGETASFAESWQTVKNNALVALEPIGSALFGVVSEGMGMLLGFMQEYGPKIGEFLSGLLPIMSSSMEPLMEIFSSLLDGLGPALESVLPMIGQLVSSFSPFQLLLDAILPIMPIIADAFLRIGEALSGALVSVLPVVTELMGILADIFAGTLSSLLPVIATLIETLAGIIAELAPHVATVAAVIGDALSGALSAVLPMLAELAPHISTVAEIIGKALSGALGAILPVLAELLSELVEQLTPVLPVLAELIGQVATTIAELFSSALQSLLPPLLEIIEAVVSALIPILPTLTELITSVAGIFVTLVESLSPVLPIIGELISQLVSALVPILPTLTELITSVAGIFLTLMESLTPVLPIIGELIGQLVTALVPILPVLTELIKIVADIFITLIEALTPLIPVIIELVGACISPLLKIMEPILPVVTDLAKLLGNSLKASFEVISPIIKTVTDVLVWLLEHALSPLTGGFTGMGDVIGKVFGGLVAIVKTPINAIIDLVNKAIGSINGISFDLPGFLGGGHVGFDIPKIPRLADGGIVRARPGGTLTVVGEAGQDEVVIPLSKLESIINIAPSAGEPSRSSMHSTAQDTRDRTIEILRAAGMSMAGAQARAGQGTTGRPLLTSNTWLGGDHSGTANAVPYNLPDRLPQLSHEAANAMGFVTVSTGAGISGLMTSHAGSLRSSAEAANVNVALGRVTLQVAGREFDAFVSEVADSRVEAAAIQTARNVAGSRIGQGVFA